MANALKSPNSVWMEPPGNEHGHPPGVTVHLISKETYVMHVLRGSREMVAKNAPLVSKVMNVNNVQRTVMEITGNEFTIYQNLWPSLILQWMLLSWDYSHSKQARHTQYSCIIPLSFQTNWLFPVANWPNCPLWWLITFYQSSVLATMYCTSGIWGCLLTYWLFPVCYRPSVYF